MTEKEIQTKLDYLSHKTIFNLLNELISEDKVYKSKMKYYLDLFIDDDWYIFAEFLNEFQRQYHLNKTPLRKIYPACLKVISLTRSFKISLGLAEVSRAIT
jgi:hypothetical protein